MKINLHSVRDAGLDVVLSPQELWTKVLLDHAVPNEKPDYQSIKGRLHIDRFNDDLDIKGEISVDLSPVCARCGEYFYFKLIASIVLHLVPTKGEQEEDEDINFAYHNGVEVDLVPLLSEQLVLALPFDFFCKHDCRGLCLTCGQNLNHATCPCAGNKPIDPRWEVLKKFAGDKKM